MRKSFLTATLLATAASYAAAPVAPYHSAEPTFDLSISGTGKGFVVYNNGKKTHTHEAKHCEHVIKQVAEDVACVDGLTGGYEDLDNSLLKIDSIEGTAASSEHSRFHNPQIEIDSNIVFSASMMHQGWKYAAYVRLDAFNKDDTHTGGTYHGEATAGDSFYLSLGHDDMGTLYLGARPGASTTKWIWMPGAGVYSLNGGDAQTTHGILTNGGELPWWSAKNNKVMYVSPDFNGFSFAASYTPHKDSAAHFVSPSKKDLAEKGLNVIEVQGMFVMDGLKISSGFANQKANQSEAWDGQLAVNNSFNVLASYSMDGFTVGAGYQTHPVFSQDKWTIYGGAEYALTDNWSFGAGYLMHDDSDNKHGDGLIVANVNYAMTKSASWNTGVSIPTKGDKWSIASGLVFNFGPNN